jgi:hypothetical protein
MANLHPFAMLNQITSDSGSPSVSLAHRDLVLDLGPPNWLIDAGLATPLLRALAQSIYFHRRGLLSPRVWSELLHPRERRRAG